MAYIKTTWSDRVVATPLTYNLQSNPDGTTTLIPAEGAITQAGTPITSSALNNIENGIVTNESLITGHETRLGTNESKITTIWDELFTNDLEIPRTHIDYEGSLIMQRASNKLFGTLNPNGNFLVSVQDQSHSFHWLVAIVHFQYNNNMTMQIIASDTLTAYTNTLGTISVQGLAGAPRFTIIGIGGRH